MAAVTGDFLFVGDVGRPDLLEKAADSRDDGEWAPARCIAACGVRCLRRLAADLAGPWRGLACGKGISAVPHWTLGYERRFNWAFRAANEEDFVAHVLEGQPDPPTYFATMKRMNKAGPAFSAPGRRRARRPGRVAACSRPATS